MFEALMNDGFGIFGSIPGIPISLKPTTADGFPNFQTSGNNKTNSTEYSELVLLKSTLQ